MNSNFTAAELRALADIVPLSEWGEVRRRIHAAAPNRLNDGAPMTDTTHITKEGLLRNAQAIEKWEPNDLFDAAYKAFQDAGPPKYDETCLRAAIVVVLARAAELSAQQVHHAYVEDQIDKLNLVPKGPLSAQESKPVDLKAAWVDLKFIMRVLQAGNEATVKDKADAYWMCKQLLEQTHTLAVSAQDASPKDGWQLVPTEATPEMLEAAKGPLGRVNDILAQHQIRYGTMDLSVDGQYPLWHAYKAMLYAAPEPPQ